MGLLVSLAVHVTIILVAAVVTFSFDLSRPASDAGGAPVELAVLPESRLAELPTGEVQANVPAVETPATEAIDAIPAPEMDVDLSALTGELSELSLDVGGGSLSAGGLEALGGGGIGGEGASFFGVEASGRRFAYVVDRSGSMTGSKIERLRQELARSVNGLGGGGEYAIILYSSAPEVLQEPLGWRTATDANKRGTVARIQEIPAAGGTDPLPAIQMALGLDPAPDAIYFMTDAESFPQDLPARVASLNRRGRVTIHCILFTEVREPRQRAGVERILQQIADDSRGSFTVVVSGEG